MVICSSDSRRWITTAQSPRHEVAVTEDHRQQVVEIVRHPARQLADRFHFLRLAKLILQVLAFGDVRPGADNLHR